MRQLLLISLAVVVFGVQVAVAQPAPTPTVKYQWTNPCENKAGHTKYCGDNAKGTPSGTASPRPVCCNDGKKPGTKEEWCKIGTDGMGHGCEECELPAAAMAMSGDAGDMMYSMAAPMPTVTAYASISPTVSPTGRPTGTPTVAPTHSPQPTVTNTAVPTPTETETYPTAAPRPPVARCPGFRGECCREPGQSCCGPACYKAADNVCCSATSMVITLPNGATRVQDLGRTVYWLCPKHGEVPPTCGTSYAQCKDPNGTVTNDGTGLQGPGFPWDNASGNPTYRPAM